MRGVVWCSAALALLAVAAGSALRPSQEESVTRTGRRQSTTLETRSSTFSSSTSPYDVEQTSIRPRGSRREEEYLRRDVTRSRTRIKPQISVESTTATPEIKLNYQTERNERFSSRRSYSRTRNRPDNEANPITSSTLSPNLRSRSRPFQRNPQTRSSAGTLPPKTIESNIELIATNLEDISKYAEQRPSSQFRRRSSTATFQSTENTVPKKGRVRINTRVRETKPEPDLESSGTTNIVSVSDKGPTTVRSRAEERIGRKLRYKTRLSETDTNLTGQGIKTTADVKSSHKTENIASQAKTERTQSEHSAVSESTEFTRPTTTSTRTKVIRRPLGKDKMNFRPTVFLSKPSSVDDIGEDDNYPESFKALLQAKNVSTHATSQSSESLTMKASEKVYKTFTSEVQSDNSESNRTQNNTRFRLKLNSEDPKEMKDTPSNGKQNNTVLNNESVFKKKMYKRTEFKPRATYNPRIRNFATSTATSLQYDETSSSEKTVYKFNKKSKENSTESPDTENIQGRRNNRFYKSGIKSSYYSRANNVQRNITDKSTFKPKGQINISQAAEKYAILPRTSYYSRLRKNKNSTMDTVDNKTSAERKDENTYVKPIIYTSVSTYQSVNGLDSTSENTESPKSNEMFVAVTSNESHEKSMENNILSNDNENDNIDVTRFISTTPKYHSRYKEHNTVENNSKRNDYSGTTTETVRNIHFRKVARNNNLGRDTVELQTTMAYKNANIKLNETTSKTTPGLTNGITPEPDKSKGRFSSKYRASYLDKPFYKPTIPSVTPSTAWLKFFVTDRDLTKSVQEPIWFEAEPVLDFTTESIPRYSIIQTSPIIHESSIELVEGEESELGPDLNAITFTQTRRTLSSADLRLSESVLKSAQVMNVEASNHSPSVTVSIFDALADILTSTPRPQLSSTTEVPHKSNINIDVKQSLNGVSSQIYVNSLRGFASQDVMATTVPDTDTNIKLVQITEKSTPIVNNQNFFGESTTMYSAVKSNDPSKKIFETSSSFPSTPVTVRRPFAFKVLYTDTEKTYDMTSSDPTSIQPRTDSPKTVFSTLPNMFVSNQNVVSSELTSMLLNNIRNLLEKMDESTRSKLSVNMDILLKNLIPRAVNGLSNAQNDFDLTPNTTPYTLEDIRDTEVKIDFNNDVNGMTTNNDLGLFQSVSNMNNVNMSEVEQVDTTFNVEQTKSTNPALNLSETISTNSFIFEFNTEPMLFEKILTTPLVTESTVDIPTENTSFGADLTTLTDILNSDTTENVGSNRKGKLISEPKENTSTEKSQDLLSIPFLSNRKISDFTLSDLGNFNNLKSSTALPDLLLSTNSNRSYSSSQYNNMTIVDQASKISPLELWILSKKASVLKMIEDLIRQHNAELAQPPLLTDTINSPLSVPLSQRLTEIINNMDTTTVVDVSNDTILSTITPDIPTIPVNLFDAFPTTSESDLYAESENLNRTKSFDSGMNLYNNFREDRKLQIMTETLTPESMTTATNPYSDSSIETFQSTIISTTDTVTSKLIVDSTTEFGKQNTVFETTPDEVIETERVTQQGSTVEVESTSSNSQIPQPKKDFVIFGILPNNTVVRKDPNDNELETLTEASPYIVYGVLPNNTIIRKFPNGTRVPRIMQKIDILPISPWSLRNPNSPVHNNPAIVRPQALNPFRVSTNVTTSTDTSNNETELTTTVNNQQITISSSALNIKDSSTSSDKPPAEKSTASHVLSLRTTTMLPSIDEILLNSISSAAKEEKVISSMTSSTREPIILTLDIDPETKQIRTEKPGNDNMSAVFKFIPIDEVTVPTQNSNVFKLATKPTTKTDKMQLADESNLFSTENIITQTPQIQMSLVTEEPTTTTQLNAGTAINTNADIKDLIFINTEIGQTQVPTGTESSFMTPQTNIPEKTTTEFQTESTPITVNATTEDSTTFTTPAERSTILEVMTTETTTESKLLSTTSTITTTHYPTITSTSFQNLGTKTIATNKVTTFADFTVPVETSTRSNIKDDITTFEKDAQILQTLLQLTGRNANTEKALTTELPKVNHLSLQNTNIGNYDLLQALLSSGKSRETLNAKSTVKPNQVELNTSLKTTTVRSIEDDIKQFEEDTKLLQALLQATGQNPVNFNIPILNTLSTTSSTTKPPVTTVTSTTTVKNPFTTTSSIHEDIKKFQEDAKLLQMLLQVTGNNPTNLNLPIISGVTSNVRMASKPLTTSNILSPTTTLPKRPVFIPETTTQQPISTTVTPLTESTTFTTFQPRETTENIRISTTFPPFTNQRRRQPTITTTTASASTSTNFERSTTPPTGRQLINSRFSVTTELPSSSTFSVDEDLAFLNNLKSVLNTNNIEDPETALANRIIALAVEKSLNEIQTTKLQTESSRGGKAIVSGSTNNLPTTTARRVMTTTTTTTTTTPKPATTTTDKTTPSIEEDIRQFQEDTKLLQALLKATGQDPATLKIPTLTTPTSNVRSSSKNILTATNDDLKSLTNLLASPSPEPFDIVTENFGKSTKLQQVIPLQKPSPAVPKAYGAKIAIKEDSKNVHDEANLLKTLIKLQGLQETTTQRTKITLTGQSPDEVLSKLLQQTKQTGMVSEATQAPMSLSTEYGKSNDALLAALLKEQGFGPTTASSVDEQVRLAALLNQVVVTPKARRTTTLPPPPPQAPRRPILDGLAWLWQQWRETGPGPGGARPSRRPSPAPSVSSSTSTSNRVNWFGSGPFVGNADEKPVANRIPLEPPAVVTSQQAPGRGQLVSAAINVTRAFSQFLGAAIQGAAQTVQNVIRAGQRVASDVYVNGSG